ncbi:hypothetical protein ACFC06_25110 [Nocardia sp. NPDC056064]|uniref:hypothetical protein n=1 Tax=Nocardia sp. NPDC056064 TaxID=3345701 RepID=UPI0035D9ED51
MFWAIVLVLGTAIGIGLLVCYLTPCSFRDIGLNRGWRRGQPTADFALLDILDHSAPCESLTTEAAQRESRAHAVCPPWLCERKAAALVTLDASNRRTTNTPRTRDHETDIRRSHAAPTYSERAAD